MKRSGRYASLISGRVLTPVRYLIDGYNLLHALGLAAKKSGRAGWFRARTIMLDWLADHINLTLHSVQIVFDAQNAHQPIGDATYRQMRLITRSGQTADDVIEELLRLDHDIDHLTVVSSDRRLRDAAYQWGAQRLTSQEFIDELMKHSPSPHQKAKEEEKPTDTSERENEEWLKVFGEGM
jgi:predicted RNA-binding protein with PIN domain